MSPRPVSRFRRANWPIKCQEGILNGRSALKIVVAACKIETNSVALFFLSKEQTGKTGSPAFSTSNRPSDRSQTASYRHFSNRNRTPHARYDIHSQPARSSLVRFPFALTKEEAGYNLANFRIEILPPSNHCESNPPGLCLFVCLSPNHYPITCRTLIPDREKGLHFQTLVA